mgnify:CR=1 FL=1
MAHGTSIRRAFAASRLLPNDKPEWKAVLFDRMNSTYQRDKNHPAVLIWSLGNESFGGETLLQMAEMVRRFDDTRLVHYEGVVNDPRFLETTDIESHMYSTVKDIKEYLAQGDKRPYIECEYSHAMGNSNGALHKYTELADQKDCGYQGGFIWDYIDQSIWKKDRYGKWFQAYGGDFGERPTDYNSAETALPTVVTVLLLPRCRSQVLLSEHRHFHRQLWLRSLE